MIMLYITPILMLILGFLWINRFPSKINNHFGYRSKRAKTSQEAWIFANKLFAKTFFSFGLISLVFTRFSINILNSSSISTIQLLLMLLALVFTEILLRLIYDEKGKRK